MNQSERRLFEIVPSGAQNVRTPAGPLGQPALIHFARQVFDPGPDPIRRLVKIRRVRGFRTSGTLEEQSDNGHIKGFVALQFL